MAHMLDVLLLASSCCCCMLQCWVVESYQLKTCVRDDRKCLQGKGRAVTYASVFVMCYRAELVKACSAWAIVHHSSTQQSTCVPQPCASQ